MSGEERETNPTADHTREANAKAGTGVNQDPGGSIPWESQAHFNDVDGGNGLTGTLAECVAAYLDLPEERRRGALITTDELVAIPDQPIPISNLDRESLDWLGKEWRER